MPGTRAMGGAPTAHSEAAEPRHYYKTPPATTRALLKVETFPERVWECACGDGAISRVLMEAGHKVISTDLVDRGFGEGGRDFLAERVLLARAAVTNPPFKLAESFALHALGLGAEKVALFSRLAWLEGSGRHKRLWLKCPPARVWVFRKRQTLWRGDVDEPPAKGGTIAFCWVVWDATHTGAPALGWLA